MASEVTGWTEQKLGELGEFRNGANFSQEDYGSGYPIVNVKQLYRGRYASMQDVHELATTALSNPQSLFLRHGDILFARSSLKASGAGQVAMVGPCKPHAIFSGFIIRFRIKSTVRVIPDYLNYLLRSPVYRELLTRIGSGTTITNLSQDTLARLSIELPPLFEQKAIVSMLGALDDKIELNRRMNETLDAMARALFKSWFVDFAPVHAQIEGCNSGFPEDIVALFPNSFEESSLGEIPKGWTVEPIDNLTEAIGGTTPSTKEPEYWTPDIHAWATPKDLSKLDSSVLRKTERRISDKGLNQIGSGLLAVGTVLLSSRAPIGYLAVAEIPVAINQGFIAMKPREGVSNLFLLYWAEVAQETIKSRANGSTFLEISKSNFRQIDVVRPDESVMKKFDAYVRPWYQRIVANEHETATLTKMRDALLPKLSSGEIRLPVH